MNIWLVSFYMEENYAFIFDKVPDCPSDNNEINKQIEVQFKPASNIYFFFFHVEF